MEIKREHVAIAAVVFVLIMVAIVFLVLTSHTGQPRDLSIYLESRMKPSSGLGGPYALIPSSEMPATVTWGGTPSAMVSLARMRYHVSGLNATDYYVINKNSQKANLSALAFFDAAGRDQFYIITIVEKNGNPVKSKEEAAAKFSEYFNWNHELANIRGVSDYEGSGIFLEKSDSKTALAINSIPAGTVPGQTETFNSIELVVAPEGSSVTGFYVSQETVINFTESRRS